MEEGKGVGDRRVRQRRRSYGVREPGNARLTPAPWGTPGGTTPEPELPAGVGPALLGQGYLYGQRVPLLTGCGPKGVEVWGVDEKAEHKAWGLGRGVPQRMGN